MPRAAARRAPPSWSTLKKTARERFGVESFRAGQRALIRAVLEGRPALGILPTGAGKSLCFQLPSLFLPGTTVVVSPLLALIRDQTQKLADLGVDATKLDSTLSASEERDAIDEVRAEGAPIVYVTPERLERPDVRALLREAGVSLLVVDEAHCVSQWGHDFRPAYLAIREAVKDLGRPTVLALTATATPELADDILRQLGVPQADVVRSDLERKNIFFEVRRTPSDEAKRAALAELLRDEPGAAIVYAATTRAVDELHASLAGEGIPVTRYHGKLKTAERKANQDAFMSGEARIVIATAAFGLGIDKPDVRLVVHYNFPDSLESYYQEAGRGGRDGEPARAVLLYRLEDRRVQAYFLGGKYPKRADLLGVYERLAAAPDHEATLAALADASGLSARRTQVIVAQLDAMGVARRRGSGAAASVRLVRDFTDVAELDRFATSYEARFETDREKLDDMMHYAQTTDCRVRCLATYFGESAEEDCGHCDTCRDHPARVLPPLADGPPSLVRPKRPPAPLGPPPSSPLSG
jgi:ATP-dependent DNA helicase RecQ